MHEKYPYAKNKIDILLARIASRDGDSSGAADTILDAACALGIHPEVCADSILSALSDNRIPAEILACQVPWNEFIYYVHSLDAARLDRLAPTDFAALAAIMADLSRGRADMSIRYQERQKAAYEAKEGAFIEAALARGFVVVHDHDGLTVRHDYGSSTILLQVCRRFVALACGNRISSLLDKLEK